MQNFVKTIINGVQKWTKKEIKEEIKKIPVVHPDWNENDNNSPNYIKNRPFYEGEVVIFDGIIEITTGQYVSTEGYSNKIIDLEVGETYTVYWDNVKYTSIGEDCDTETVLGFNNGINISDAFGNHPMYVYNAPLGTHTLKITKHGYHKLDSKYLPTNLATTDDVENAKQEALNATNPVGIGSFSMNRKSRTTVGANSVALGFNTTASGDYSHAEGFYTTASGFYSHAEGNHTTATGSGSHAEGFYTTATATGSHAEGFSTTAKNKAQHVQGEYNILDATGSTTARGTYAHIVGNGTSDTTCSNAHTLDWEGNAWYQGDVYVGSTSGTNKDEGSKKLATEEYVNTAINNQLVLTDDVTGIQYKLSISDGKLTMTEVTA